MKIMSEYIDFSKNKQLQQEVADMSGLGVSILTEGIEKGEQNIIELYNWLMEQLILISLSYRSRKTRGHIPLWYMSLFTQ